MAKRINITLIKSMVGRPEKHRKILRGMGLTKIGRTKEFPDTPASRGMASKVSHLVKVEEKADEA